MARLRGESHSRRIIHEGDHGPREGDATQSRGQVSADDSAGDEPEHHDGSADLQGRSMTEAEMVAAVQSLAGVYHTKHG